MFCGFIPPKAQKLYRLGRSSDLSFFECLPILFLRTVACGILKDIERTYSSGSVQDLHLIPFSSRFPLMEWKMRTKIGSKDKKKNATGYFLFLIP